MTIQEWFDKRKEAQIERRAKDIKGVDTDTPELWTKCVHCETQLLKTELEDNMMVCPHCDYHYRINAKNRILQLFDEGSFELFFLLFILLIFFPLLNICLNDIVFFLFNNNKSKA